MSVYLAKFKKQGWYLLSLLLVYFPIRIGG